MTDRRFITCTYCEGEGFLGVTCTAMCPVCQGYGVEEAETQPAEMDDDLDHQPVFIDMRERGAVL